jgi:hypothetical protein
MQVRQAVRMSCSVPGVFLPYEYEGHLYVDGGILNDCAIGAVPANNSIRCGGRWQLNSIRRGGRWQTNSIRCGGRWEINSIRCGNRRQMLNKYRKADTLVPALLANIVRPTREPLYRGN